MNLSKVTAISAGAPTIAAVRPADAASDSSQQSSQREQQQSEPDTGARRFPWLSWETRQLEAASKQPSPYGRVPLLGETLDQKV